MAHIRRANPRDGLPRDSVIEPRFHRIIRRSMPYGPFLAVSTMLVIIAKPAVEALLTLVLRSPTPIDIP